jgi:hypothetical protein
MVWDRGEGAGRDRVGYGEVKAAGDECGGECSPHAPLTCRQRHMRRPSPSTPVPGPLPRSSWRPRRGSGPRPPARLPPGRNPVMRGEGGDERGDGGEGGWLHDLSWGPRSPSGHSRQTLMLHSQDTSVKPLSVCVDLGSVRAPYRLQDGPVDRERDAVRPRRKRGAGRS